MPIATTKSDDFPRSSGTRQISESRPSFVSEDDQLFKSKKSITSKQILKKKKQTIEKTASSFTFKKNKIVIEHMTLSRLVENIIIYGCVYEIDDFEIRLSVSGGIIVKVPITNISNAYTKLIENFADNSASEEVEVSKLTAFFQIGDYYPVKILSKQACDHFGHTEIIGSVNPQDIYSNFSSKTVTNLPDGFNILAAVSSLEDYGYEMDLGINGVKAFLPLDDLKKYLNGAKLNIGQLVSCSVFQKNDRSVILTTNKKFSNFCLSNSENASIHWYVPGVKIQCSILNVRNSGLELSLPGDYSGFTPRYHISDDILTVANNFKIGDSVQGHVLYVQPHTKQVCISLKAKLDRKTVKNLINSIKPGLIINNAVICGIGQFGTTIFKLPGNSFAVSLSKNLCESQEYETLKLNGKFAVGTTHICRVKKFHLFDNLIEISLKKSFLEQKELSLEDLRIGAIVEGTVKKFKPNGIYIRLGFGLNGFIPNMHLTDAPFVSLKNREKMFANQKSITCRITRLDTSLRVPKISLTIKKTLLNLQEVFSDITQIQPGMSSTGVICLITEKGILLEFFDRICGFIPLKYLSTYHINSPEQVFSVGQLIKATVVAVDVHSKRMVCSLISMDETKKLKVSSKFSDKRLQNSTLQVGQILKKMKIVSRTARGFDLLNNKEDIQVFLSVQHLSDDVYITRLFFAALKVGDIIDQVMVFSKDSTNVVCVTMKRSFVEHADLLVTKETDVQIDQPFAAIVRNITHDGVFFETPNAQYGVIRRKQLQDGFYDDPYKLGLVRGQTIYVSAVDLVLRDEKDGKNGSKLNRFKFSMKLSDVWDKGPSAKVELMHSYLRDVCWALQLFQSKSQIEVDPSNMHSLFQATVNKFVPYSIGQVATYVVSNITSDNIEVKISLTGNKNDPTVSGLAINYTDFGELSVSHMGNAVICDFDFDRKLLLVFIQPQPAKLVRQVRNSQKSNFVKNLKIGQSLKGTVIFIGPRYVLVALAGHAPGVIAYISARRHRNDLGQVEKLYSLGQDYHFTIQHIDSDQRVIAVLNTDSSKTSVKGKCQEKTLKTASINNELDLCKSKAMSTTSRNTTELPTLVLPKQQSSIQSLSNNEGDNQFQWNIPDLTPNLTKKRKIDCDLKEDEDSNENFASFLEDSDSEENSQCDKKRQKTREQRNIQSHQIELELRQKEIELSNSERTPRNEQDFEMAVVASPNSSLVWLRYMSFYLEQGETNKARSTAERALERISFREEKEKLNIWIGLINLENTFGDQTSMDALIQRAIKFNDCKTIYLQLASIYDNSNKKEKAEQIYHLAIKKFKQNKSVWIEFFVFYMQNKRLESARKLFQRSLLSIEKRDHVDVISKFAQLEFRFGDTEQAKTIFESMLATYWKRLDQWSIYIDMLVKYTVNETNLDSVQFVRNIFERLITFKLPPQKMKFIFKKYYDFESKFSADNFDILDRIKQKALEYIESDIF